MDERTEASFAPSTDPSAPPSLTKPRKQEADRKAVGVGVIVAVVVVLLLVASVILLLIDPARTANIRDIVIILFAFGSLLISLAIGVLMVVLVFRVQELIGFLRSELVPMMNNIQKTMNTVRGTTDFVSENVTKPTIKVASFLAGMQQMAKTANNKVKNRTGKESK